MQLCIWILCTKVAITLHSSHLDTSAGAKVIIDDARDYQIGIQCCDDERQKAGNACHCPAIHKGTHLGARGGEVHQGYDSKW